MKKKHKKLVIIALLFFLLVMAAGYTLFIQPLLEKEEIVYEEAEVFKGPLAVKVVESGSLEYTIHNIAYDVDVNVETEDDDDDEDEDEELVQKYLKIEAIYAAAGTNVKEGEPLLKFSDDSVEGVRKLLQNALVNASADYNEAEIEYKLSVLEAETNYELQKISGKYATTIYKDESSMVSNDITAMEMEIAELNSNISDLEEAIATAEENYADAKTLYDEVYYSYMNHYTSTENGPSFMAAQNNYVSVKNSYERAETNLQQARENLENNAAQITQLQHQVAVAKAKSVISRLEAEQTYSEDKMNAENADYSLSATLESLAEELDEAAEEKKILEEKLSAFEKLVGTEGIVYAVENGLITSVAYSVGDTLETTGNLFSYATEDKMSITVDVTQEDIVTLAVGDEVNIVFSAYDKNYQGYIESINTTATSAETPTVSYQVVIHVVGSLEELFDGMTANVSFVTEEKEEAVYVSRRALVEENGKTYVYVKSGLAGRTLTEVETGIRNESYVEIIAGITEADTIYVPTQK